ncbi:tetratricopeptide repeat protein, partial [Kitasatospora sp. NPDC001660]
LAHQFWAPGFIQAERLLAAGRISEAAALLRDDASAESATAHLTPAGLALAEGRYEKAELLAAEAMEHGCPSHVPYLIVGMAFVGRADRGEVSHERAGALLDPFLVRLGINDRTLYRGFLPTADVARFQNDPDTAVRVARPLSTAVGSAYWRAQAGCSLAAALIAAGRPDEARKALARARKECPELVRISDVERMLEKAA